MQYFFFGSGPVAVQSFKTLRDIFDFTFVVTKSTTAYEFRELFDKEYIVIADTKSKVDEFVTTNVEDESVGILIDFGVLISQKSIDAFSSGIVNSHFSLLPNLRGAAPINHAILGGFEQTGVSLMTVDQGMDTGDIIAQSIVPIGTNMYVDELREELVGVSNSMLREIIPLYIEQSISAVPQDSFSDEASYAPKISKSDGEVSSDTTAELLDRMVRAYRGWPGVSTAIAGLSVTIEEGFIFKDSDELVIKPGEFQKYKKDGQIILLMGTTNGIYAITRLKPDSKQSMSAEGFLAGYGDKI